MKHLLGIISAASLLAVSMVASAQTPVVTWNTQKAIIQGSGSFGAGCSKDVDTWTITSGNDLSVVFTNLKVDLPGNGANSATSGRAQCTVRIPVDVVRGFYLGRLTQTLTAGATKSDNVDLSVGTRSTFFNIPVQNLSANAPKGPGTAFNSAQMTDIREDIIPVTRFCSLVGGPNVVSGMFNSNVSVSALRDTPADDAIIGADSLDVRWDVAAQWFVCP